MHSPIKEGYNKANGKVFRQNIERGSQNQLGHPLTLEVPLHGEHPHLPHFTKKRKKRNRTKWNAQNLNVV